jgi:hypothetical protein
MFLFLGKDTVTGKMKYQSSTVTFAQEIPTGTVNGSNADFVLVNTPVAAQAVFVYVDGQIKYITTDWTINLGTKTITLAAPPQLGQTVYVVYLY